ncbi:hypothetical protein F1737_03920 [Methanoplanus sp. FWC-SCC4]|uniref:Uncharacterized protein n=1 Tax=Methanochimaera problematica TaxID=2609417 RepID=A0AA97FCB4_9EURY|nr:hypothetical protein [Methanoplanus sp. FWC-SCC4]WOF15902.1 hypothetical protein F1737_03920 [Methanoplanus sp. FWC-SCC4]
MVSLKTLKCTNCGNPLTSKEKDKIFVCSKCQNIMEFLDGDVKKVESTIARFNKSGNSEKVYMPFWVVNTDIKVNSEKIVGGRVMRFLKSEKKMSGNQDLYVCAADISPDIVKGWNVEFTLRPPAIEEEDNFQGIPRVPAFIDNHGAKQHSEFMFLRHEAEISGTLQKIDYDFNINSYRIVYVPFYKNKNKYQVGI